MSCLTMNSFSWLRKDRQKNEFIVKQLLNSITLQLEHLHTSSASTNVTTSFSEHLIKTVNGFSLVLMFSHSWSVLLSRIFNKTWTVFSISHQLKNKSLLNTVLCPGRRGGGGGYWKCYSIPATKHWFCGDALFAHQ